MSKKEREKEKQMVRIKTKKKINETKLQKQRGIIRQRFLSNGRVIADWSWFVAYPAAFFQAAATIAALVASSTVMPALQGDKTEGKISILRAYAFSYYMMYKYTVYVCEW